jgi:hypothetical protein
VEPETAELKQVAGASDPLAIYTRLQEKFGEDAFYWPTASFVAGGHGGLIGGSLADDLDDIYGEVKYGLDLLAASESESEAVWNWRFSFWNHWGNHALKALWMIHNHLASIGYPPKPI